MCAILGILDLRTGSASLRKQAVEMSRRQRHRGPDWSGVVADDRAILVHERLAIVDIDGGAQPLVSQDGTLVLAVNGEIYNHRELEASLPVAPVLRTRSDCEVILELYRQRDADFLNDLNGIFAFILHDAARDRFLIARDPIGVVPLFTGRDEHGNFYVASEMKALLGVCRTIEEFPPGSYLDSEIGEPVRYFHPSWRSYDAVPKGSADPQRLRLELDRAVERQMMSDVPWGVLLSGGLDSSIIAALAAKHARGRIETGGASEAWWPRLHSFSIGLDGSPDLDAARVAADAIGSVHHQIHFTIEEGLDALSEVIHHIETFDVTTIRASVPMYLMARRIRAAGIKMVLSGEGADEIFGGYLYFHKAPDPREFHEETVRKLDLLHRFDCLRANKSMAAWGVEARVPFLDRDFLELAMNIDPAEKMITPGRMEKHLLRDAFRGWLPDEILWRQKEQFSDGVGYGWIDALRDLAEREVSERELASAAYRFPRNTPLTREAYLYRKIFESHFPDEQFAGLVPEGRSIACSTPAALRWDPDFANRADPSGRSVSVHKGEVSKC